MVQSPGDACKGPQNVAHDPERSMLNDSLSSQPTDILRSCIHDSDAQQHQSCCTGDVHHSCAQTQWCSHQETHAEGPQNVAHDPERSMLNDSLSTQPTDILRSCIHSSEACRNGHAALEMFISLVRKLNGAVTRRRMQRTAKRGTRSRAEHAERQPFQSADGYLTQLHSQLRSVPQRSCCIGWDHHLAVSFSFEKHKRKTESTV